MNRLKKYIYEHGELIAKGSSRMVYRVNDKVYKIPNKPIGTIQSQEEKRIYESFELEAYKHLFPNPKFMGNIVQLDYVECFNLEEDLNFDGYIIMESTLDPFQVKLVYNFLHKMEVIHGVIDLLPYLDNVGINIDFKVVDWGWTSKTEEFLRREEEEETFLPL